MSPFEQQLLADAQALQNGEEILNVNGTPMGMAIWNLILTKRDLTLWCKLGMKPNRHWKVTTAKQYFGITGSGEKLLERFMTIFDKYMGDE